MISLNISVSSLLSQISYKTRQIFKASCCSSDIEDLYKIFVKRLTMAALVICIIALSRLFLLRYMSRNKELCRTVKNMQFRISSLKALARSNRPLYSNGRGIYVSNVMMDTFASVRLLCGKSVVTPVAEQVGFISNHFTG